MSYQPLKVDLLDPYTKQVKTQGLNLSHIVNFYHSEFLGHPVTVLELSNGKRKMCINPTPKEWLNECFKFPTDT